MTNVFEIVSHSEPTVEQVLTGSNGMAADHVVGCSAFTAEGRRDGVEILQHRFGVVVLCDPKTAHGLTLETDMMCSVITGLLDRFKEILYATFGDEAVSLAMMQGIVEMLGVDDDDETQVGGPNVH